MWKNEGKRKGEDETPEQKVSQYIKREAAKRKGGRKRKEEKGRRRCVGKEMRKRKYSGGEKERGKRGEDEQRK